MKKTEKFKFSEYFDELKKINEEFENKDLALEEAMKKFERGLFLAKNLKNRLNEIENYVEEIKIKFEDFKKDNEPESIDKDNRII